MSLPSQVKLLGQHHFQFVVYVERTEWHINAIQKAENVDNVKKKRGVAFATQKLHNHNNVLREWHHAFSVENLLGCCIWSRLFFLLQRSK